MNRLCTYIVTTDAGLAPNPFWGVCTLSVCTPNRRGALLEKGDWIAGFYPKHKGYKLIYAMEISERLNMNDYFHDNRYQRKKPNLKGSWKERCGDNFYSLNENGEWKQHKNRFHIGPIYLAKDTQNPYIFASEKFWYLGKSAVTPPKEFASMIGGRGIRVNHPKELAQEFTKWVESAFKEGITNEPNDNPDINA